MNGHVKRIITPERVEITGLPLKQGDSVSFYVEVPGYNGTRVVKQEIIQATGIVSELNGNDAIVVPPPAIIPRIPSRLIRKTAKGLPTRMLKKRSSIAAFQTVTMESIVKKAK